MSTRNGRKRTISTHSHFLIHPPHINARMRPHLCAGMRKRVTEQVLFHCRCFKLLSSLCSVRLKNEAAFNVPLNRSKNEVNTQRRKRIISLHIVIWPHSRRQRSMGGWPVVRKRNCVPCFLCTLEIFLKVSFLNAIKWVKPLSRLAVDCLENGERQRQRQILLGQVNRMLKE